MQQFELIETLKEEYHTSRSTQSILKVWGCFLERLSENEMRNGLMQILSTKTDSFFPTIGEFLRHAGVNPSEEEQVTTAWNLLWKTIASKGTDYSLQWKDAALAATIQALGGLEAIGEILTEEKSFWKKDFRAEYLKFSGKIKRGELDGETVSVTQGAYQRLAESQRVDAQSQKIRFVGYSSQEMAFLGLTPPDPSRLHIEAPRLQVLSAAKKKDALEYIGNLLNHCDSTSSKFAALHDLIENHSPPHAAPAQKTSQKTGREYPLGDIRRIAAEKKIAQELATKMAL